MLFRSSSTLDRFGLTVLFLSGDADLLNDDLELDAVGDVVPEGPGFGEAMPPFCAPFATLPIRMRGTLVWIFCSNTLTRARISETICTPLLRVAATVLVVLVLDTLRVKTGAGMGVRPAIRVVGAVLERVSGEGMPEGDAARAERGWKPARCRMDEWLGTEAVACSTSRGAVATIGGTSFAGTA